MNQKRIISLTFNPTVDKSSAVDTVASEIKLRCDPPRFDAGGGGINVSRAIRKLGGDSLAVYTQGGATGSMLHQLLDGEGVRQHPIAITGMTRENLTVFERTSTHQFRFGMPGPVLNPAEWDACIQALIDSDADYVVASGSLCPEMPDDAYAQLARRLPNAEQRLIVDTSGAALEAMKGTNVLLLKPNLDEIEALSGEKFQGEEELIAVARHLIERRMAQVLVISMGSAGALMVSADEDVHVRPPVVPIRSKVGAGDSMVGGLTLALARGWSLREAVRYGVACGSAAVMSEGTGLCQLEDVERLYPRVKVLS